MTIEIAGLPGSGKSTIIRELVAADSSLASAVVSSSLRQLARQPLATLPRMARWAPSLLRWSNKRAGRLLVQRRVHQDILSRPGLILEEGIVHHLWRETYLTPALSVEPWHPLVQVSTPLIVLEAADRTRHNRLTTKEAPGPINWLLASVPVDSRPWTTSRTTFDQILRETERFRPILRVDTYGSITDSAQRVQAALAIYL